MGIETGSVYVPGLGAGFGYDTDGNLIGDGRWIYTWDGENRLTKIESLTNAPSASKRKLEFAYDHRGRRIAKTASIHTNGAYQVSSQTRFVYDGWNLAAEIGTNGAVVRSYLWGLDLSGSMRGAGGVGGLLMLTAQSTNHFVACDGNGNVTALVNANSGSLTANYEYGPFGETIRVTGSAAASNPFRFSTKYEDAETSLLYYGYRRTGVVP